MVITLKFGSRSKSLETTSVYYIRATLMLLGSIIAFCPVNWNRSKS